VTGVTMIAFASNSILCRLALAADAIDPIGFTTVRLAAGAIALLAIARLGGRRRTADRRGSWASGLALFVYALGFSLAYVRLDAGVGALVLFGFVQLTMIVRGFLGGERPDALQWAGLATATVGLVVLVFPGLTAPAPPGAALMAAAGIAWGVYSLRGRGALDPVVSTTDNFVRAVPMALAVAAVALGRLHATPRGILLAVASGAIASGVGYVLWYVALRGLTATRAASVQLTVPVIAAVGGVLFLSETVTARLAAAAVLVLGGVGATLVGRIRRAA
jgi:drug/metabolite transporter (DMT)-like permease